METENYKELLEYFIHEATQLNANIKSHSELLSKGINDKTGIIHHSTVINESSSVMSVLIEIVTYRLNPNYFKSTDKDFRNIHGKFHKSFLSFKRRMKEKSLNYTLKCDVKCLVNLYPIFDTLPYLLIDNAIKYSHKDGDISTDIDDLGHNILITVENYGPEVYEDELDLLFNKDYRGRNAIEVNPIGNGLGLDIVKNICDLHNGTIKIVIGDDSYMLNGINYKLFRVEITLPKK
jgi:light-regulated signal transduction histidine kinase (bacteriophytochrome)